MHALFTLIIGIQNNYFSTGFSQSKMLTQSISDRQEKKSKPRMNQSEQDSPGNNHSMSTM